MKKYQITSNQIKLMKHCIGFSGSKVTGIKHRKMETYRNYFITSNDDKELDSLVEQGLMIKRRIEYAYGENPHVYSVSEEGFEFLSEITEIKITEMD